MSRCNENASFFSENSGKPASMSLIVLTLVGPPSLSGAASQPNVSSYMAHYIPFRKLRIGFSKLSEIIYDFAEQILHVHMPISGPDLVGLSDFDLFRLFIGLTSINGVFVCDLVRIFDIEQVQRHSLIGKFVYQRGHEIHRTISD